MKKISLRPERFDELGLRRAMAARIVALLVAAMAFLASLSVAGWTGAAALARQWEAAASASLTIQVPRGAEPDAKGGGTRVAAVMADLIATPGVAFTKILAEDEVNALLRPWLGADLKNLVLPIPAVIAAHLNDGPIDLATLAAKFDADAPGTVVESHAAWSGGLGALVRSLELCAGLVLLIVTLVTATVIAAAVRSGLATRRHAVAIISQLGATDGFIARRFAARAALFAAAGGAIGGGLALPVTFGLAILAAPLSGLGAPATTLAEPPFLVPTALLLMPAILAVVAGVIGYATAQIAVRGWLRRTIGV